MRVKQNLSDGISGREDLLEERGKWRKKKKTHPNENLTPNRILD